jgi:cellobiose phosphorylase
MKKAAKKKSAKPVDVFKKFGAFDDKTNAFVIRTPQTPRPWENALWNDRLGIHISNHGTGSAVKSGETTSHPQSLNRFIYVYDRKEKELWSPSWFPVGRKLDSYEVRHGLEYTIFKASKNGIEITWSVTLHHTDAAEIWRLDLKNAGRKEKDLLVVPFYQVDPQLKTTCSGSDSGYRSFVSKKIELSLFYRRRA